MRTCSLVARLALPLMALLAAAGSSGAASDKAPVAAVVVEDEEPSGRDRFVAVYRVKVTADHPDFARGTEVRISLTAATTVVRGTGKDARAARPGGWSRGTRLHFSRYDGVQESRPPNVSPGLVVLGERGR